VESQVRYGMVAAPYSMPDITTLMTVIHYSMKKALGLPVNTPSAQLYNPVEEFGVGLLDVREEYHKKLVQSLDQTLRDKGRIGNLIGGLVRWHHEHGIQAGSWLSMGPVARKLTTAWEAGIEIGGAVGQRPGVLRDLKGKRVDNGWGWGVQRTLQEPDVTPLIELGVLTLDYITTPQGTALMGVDGFKRKFPKAKARHVRSLMKAREALCVETSDDNKPAPLAEATKPTPPKAHPLKRSWQALESGPDAAAQPPIEVSLRGQRKRQKRRKKQAAGPVPPPADQEEEQAVRLHKCRDVGGHRQYLVEWADTWTDGHKVKRQPHHNIGTVPKKGGHREEIERVLEERQNEQGTTEYKVKWVKTWEPAAYLIPKIGGASPLIVQFHQEKLANGNMDGGEKEREEEMACDPDTTTTHDEEAHKQLNQLLTILTTDANPDKDAHGTGRATIHATADGRCHMGTGTTSVYDAKGRHMGQLTRGRIAQLHRRYTKYKRDHRDDPPDTFPEELARLMQRYKTGSTGEKSATGKVKMTNHWTLPGEYMKAIHDTMGTVRERFASPLNVNERTTEYWAAFRQDRFFGAHHDAYSVQPTGPSEANPEYETEELYETMKWAIRGTYTDTPTCTMLVYPRWKAEPYQDLLAHPRVHILHRVPQPHFSFDTPAKYTGTPDKRAHNAHWDVAFIIVANIQGYDKYVDETKATAAFQGADTHHCGKTFPVALLTEAQKRDMAHGTHDVAGASDKPYHTDTVNAQNGVPDAQEDKALQGEYTRAAPLQIATPDDVYTDGSLKRGEELKAGAGVFFTSSGRTMHIKFTGKKAILRAELIAILVALREWELDDRIIIYTDSLLSLTSIQQAVRRKGDTRGLKESALIREIYGVLLRRTAPTYLRKVRAHVGVEGNEKADRAAVDAADGILPRNASMELVNTPEETGVSELWMTTDGINPAPDPVDTRNKYDKEARRQAERLSSHPDYCRMAEIKTVSHEPSNAFVTSKSISHRDKAWVWKARSNSIATRKRRKQWGMLGPKETATCTLCRKADDTVGHRLGGCKHDTMGGLYVKRHDHVVKTLVGAFRRGSRGGWAVEYNAGTNEDGSTHTMIHERLLRSARQSNTRGARRDVVEWDKETAELVRLKPDVMIYEGVRQEELR
jgi:ribonuclease HI